MGHRFEYVMRKEPLCVNLHIRYMDAFYGASNRHLIDRSFPRDILAGSIHHRSMFWHQLAAIEVREFDGF